MAITRPVPRFRARINGDKLEMKDSRFFSKYLSLHDKKEVMITVEEIVEPLDDQLRALYFGVIIRGACMSSNEFSTCRDEMEIHEYLQEQLRGKVEFIKRKVQGYTLYLPVSGKEDVLQYGCSDFRKYLDDVTLFLETEHGIQIKNYEDYKVDRSRITKKIKL